MHLFDRPREASGVFGVYAPKEEAARLAYFGLSGLQHRGQDSAGIAAGSGQQIVVQRDFGLVAQVFNEKNLSALTGEFAIGATQYLEEGTSWEATQPALFEAGGSVAVALNGGLLASPCSFHALFAEEASDAKGIARFLASAFPHNTTVGLLTLAREFRGVFALVVLDEHRLYALRDSSGLRPLFLGRLPSGGYLAASETCAIQLAGGEVRREIEPGELVTISRYGLYSRQFAAASTRQCFYEFVHFSRPDSLLAGHSIYRVRHALGRELAREAPADGDLVIGIPETGNVSAQGFAAECGIAYGDGLIKNRYVGRTGVAAPDGIRQLGVRMKFNPLKSAVAKKRLVIVDDAIRRGTTTREVIRVLRQSGAREIHLRVSSPPVRWPCFYGLSLGNPKEFVAAQGDEEAIRSFLGADSLKYLSIEGMAKAGGLPDDQTCHACFSGHYPIAMSDEDALATAANVS